MWTWLLAQTFTFTVIHNINKQIKQMSKPLAVFQAIPEALVHYKIQTSWSNSATNCQSVPPPEKVNLPDIRLIISPGLIQHHCTVSMAKDTRMSSSVKHRAGSSEWHSNNLKLSIQMESGGHSHRESFPLSQSLTQACHSHSPGQAKLPVLFAVPRLMRRFNGKCGEC